MDNKYKEAMDRVEVTEEMRTRILNHIEEETVKKEKRGKIISFPHIRQYASIAAVFAVFIIGVFAYTNLHTNTTSETDTTDFVASTGYEEVGSIEELKSAVGFEVETFTELPFTADEISYVNIDGEIAEVTYTGGEGSITYRKSVGSDDNSGDYSAYENEAEIEIADQTVLLKGNDDTYMLAIWNDGQFSYSLAAQPGMSVDEWEDLIENLHET